MIYGIYPFSKVCNVTFTFSFVQEFTKEIKALASDMVSHLSNCFYPDPCLLVFSFLHITHSRWTKQVLMLIVLSFNKSRRKIFPLFAYIIAYQRNKAPWNVIYERWSIEMQIWVPFAILISNTLKSYQRNNMYYLKKIGIYFIVVIAGLIIGKLYWVW